jgi:hypothetical protein
MTSSFSARSLPRRPFLLRVSQIRFLFFST